MVNGTLTPESILIRHSLSPAQPRFARKAGVLLWVLAAISMLVGSSPDVIQRRIEQLAFPHVWSVVGWEGRHLPSGLRLVLAQSVDDEAELGRRVDAFLADPTASAGDPGAPLLLARAAATGLRRAGARTIGAHVFPPVSLAVTQAPRLLVVSPRDRIAFSHGLVLDGATPMQDATRLEEQVERLGVSTLVVEEIALGTYPVLIPEHTPARSALSTVAHEWTHVALAPSILALAYGSSAEARAINETAADLVAEEVLAGWTGGAARSDRPTRTDPVIRDELRRIRLEVDALLARGAIGEAERFMEEARLDLVGRGYRIRRLNQAYFAFHGSYAEGPSASTEVPDGLRTLRERSSSLAEFLDRVGRLSSVDDLRRALQE